MRTLANARAPVLFLPCAPGSGAPKSSPPGLHKAPAPLPPASHSPMLFQREPKVRSPRQWFSDCGVLTHRWNKESVYQVTMSSCFNKIERNGTYQCITHKNGIDSLNFLKHILNIKDISSCGSQSQRFVSPWSSGCMIQP